MVNISFFAQNHSIQSDRSHPIRFQWDAFHSIRVWLHLHWTSDWTIDNRKNSTFASPKSFFTTQPVFNMYTNRHLYSFLFFCCPFRVSRFIVGPFAPNFYSKNEQTNKQTIKTHRIIVERSKKKKKKEKTIEKPYR